jgi:parallel beta-helix repeat protein
VTNRLPLRATGVLIAAAAAVLGLQSAASAHDRSTVVVSANGSGGGDCRHPDARTIQKGVSLARAGGTVVVCSGTYKESVDISTPRLTLQGQRGAVVDATGKSYGIGVGADRVTVTGMTVKNAAVGLPGLDPTKCGDPRIAVCAGIVTFAAKGHPPVAGNRLTIIRNVLTGNVGFGIDVASTRDSVIKDNKADANGIGINVVDDLNIAVRDNTIAGNETDDNKNGCGIALASHTGAGVVGNVVKGNEADRNGLVSGGAGVLLATPVPTGVVRDNQLVGNSASGNGHAGIEVHFHPDSAKVDGNTIVGNHVGRNNTLGDYGVGAPKTTPLKTVGIYVGSNSRLTIVVRDNEIRNDDIGIFQAGPHVTTVRRGNDFRHVGKEFVAIPDFA